MRIAHITTFLQGGAGRIITALALAQRRAGHDVVLVLDAGGASGYETYPEYAAALDAGGVRLLRVTSTFARDLASNTNAARDVRRALRAWPADIAHAHAAIPALVARLALAGRTVPVIHTMHGWGVAKTTDQARTDVALLNLAEIVVTPSHAARGALVELGVTDAPIQVIPYGIAAQGDGGLNDIDAIDRALFDRVRAERAPLLLCIGTIGARKHQRLLLEALAQTPLAHVHAVFIGDGETEALRAEAHTLGVSARAHVLGYRRDASRYLRRGTLLVLPSRNEGLPIVVLEALREACPVVASALPEIAEAIDDRSTGYLFEASSSAALTQTLVEALGASSDETTAMRQRMRDVFEMRFSQDRMIAAYGDLYQRICTETANSLDANPR